MHRDAYLTDSKCLSENLYHFKFRLVRFTLCLNYGNIFDNVLILFYIEKELLL